MKVLFSRLWRIALNRGTKLAKRDERNQQSAVARLRRVFQLEQLEDRYAPSVSTLPTLPLKLSSPPLTSPSFAATAGTVPVVINVLANDPQPAGFPLLPATESISVRPQHGSATVNLTTGAITYIPSANFTGTDIFSYTVANNLHLRSLPTNVTVTVGKGPTAVDDWSDTDGTTPVTIDVLANDTPSTTTLANLVPSSVTISSKPADGSAVANADGTITYTAKAGFSGTDSFSYTVKDTNNAISSVANVFVRVNRPTAADEWTDTDGTTPVTLSVLPDAADPDGNQHLVPSSVTIVSQPAHGSAVANGDGSITYTAAANFSGTDSFTYTISDDNGGVSLPAHFFVRVNRPTAADQWTDTDGTTPVTLNVVQNATDPDGNQNLVPSSVIVTSQPANGVAVANGDGTITYTANTNFSGTDSFTYTISDDNGGVSLPAHFFVRVNRPTGGSTAVQTNTTTPVVINLLAQSTDPDGNQHLVPSSVTVVSAPADGIAVANGDGTVTYTANAGFTGTDSFQYTIADDNGGVSLPSTVSVTVLQNGASSAPVINTDGTGTVSIPLANFTGVSKLPGRLATSGITILSQPADGTVVFSAKTQTMNYIPRVGFSGVDFFEVALRNTLGASSGPIKVSVVGHQPVAGDDWSDTDGTTPVVINVLANDDAAPGGNAVLVPSTVQIVSRPADGNVTVNADGTITYTAKAGFAGTDSFTYLVRDNRGGVSLPAHVYVRINRPVAADEWTDTDGTTPVTLSVLADAGDPDGDQNLVASSVRIVTPPAHGVAIANPDGTITYTANPGFMGTDSFAYTISDDNGGVSLPAHFYVRVNRPTAADQWTNTVTTTPVTLSVLDNATDPDGNQHLVPSSVTIVTQPAHGVAVANADGSITYTAKDGFIGTDSLKYTISDDNGGVSLPADFLVSVDASPTTSPVK